MMQLRFVILCLCLLSAILCLVIQVYANVSGEAPLDEPMIDVSSGENLVLIFSYSQSFYFIFCFFGCPFMMFLNLSTIFTLPKGFFCHTLKFSNFRM